uniref:Uncharacterized protein n=1 Tax=Crocodylus porosus TaxID=8502 RepID=A0A7M4FKB6_CROPO
MKQYLEDELKRESEAAEQRMAHKLQRVQMECALEKMQAVAEARRQEREAQLHEAKILAKEVYQKKFDQLTKEKQYEMNIALDISQKENQENTEKQLREAKAEHQVKLEETLLEQKEAEAQIQTLNQQLENMTVWKNSLEAEIADTRQAFQKYIDVTFPQLSPGQADFILPFRKTTDYTDQEKGAKPCDEESMACPKMGVRFTVTTGQYHK